MRLPTGRLIPTLSPTILAAALMITGIVNSVMTLLSAVSVKERATSPPASLEKTLEELPEKRHDNGPRAHEYFSEILKPERKPKVEHQECKYRKYNPDSHGQRISLPKGKTELTAILKCWTPQGIPTIVTQKTSPKTR